MRDSFAVTAPDSVAQVEACLLGIAGHSTQLAGAIQQVVQLDV